MTLEIKYKIWLEANSRVVFGQGRRELLEAIEECKSLNAAAKKLNMSYRAAWGRLKASEERLGVKLVDHVAGEAMHLTKEARTLLAEFKALEEQLKILVLKAGPKLNQFGSDRPRSTPSARVHSKTK
ncbi:MAG: LysR family transcriptional regulator [Syntrophaceae bacterium]